MVVQGYSRGGRAAPGHSLQQHPLCWITYNGLYTMPPAPSCTSESAISPVPQELGRVGGWAFPLDPEESKQGKS